ncbi:hypothetical protein [Embleya sp. NBC_00896]|uniref:hypothetical protein n=1 Tax=Embleya sp. NBC_00896 TaxID=2975961 RepID=UPI002F90FE0A|nr:hypothetical protein OG928_40275 [Embleya sp. NBC_00896]
MSDTPFVIDRVLGNGPFAQIGDPAVVARDDARGLIAVGGNLGHLQWSGRDVGARRRNHRVGVYAARDLTCRRIAASHWPINTLDFHPTLPLLAIGTGCYDGGYLFEGELLLLDLDSGRLVSALKHPREVLDVRWRHDGVLDLVLSPYDDYRDERAHHEGHPVAIERDDWLAVPERSIIGPEQASARIARERRPWLDDSARRQVEELAAACGATWTPRRKVWAVEELPDGRILAVLEGTKLESWLPDGQPQWSVPGGRGGRQILLAADGESAWVTVEPPRTWTGSGWRDEPTDVERLSLADGRVLATLNAPTRTAGTLTARADGWFGLRDTSRQGDRPMLTLVPPAGAQPAIRLPFGGYDLFNHYFAVRRSPRLLFLVGDKQEPHLNKWIVAVDPPRAGGESPGVHRLFPLEWDTRRHGHLYGGPAVHVDDARGPALIHAGAGLGGQGLLPDGAFVVRRALPGGAAHWVFTADFPVTALDLDTATNTLYAAFNSGEIVALDAAHGTVRRRVRLHVDDIPAEPLSLTVPAPNRLIIGTTDGRILRCRTA